MKKRFTALLLSVAAAISCTAFSACDETEKKKTNGTTAEGSWYEEKSGYKFCGYYKDENFTQPVTVKVTEETADKYHAKYQPDKVQLYECKPVDLEHTIYATNFQDAASAYLEETGGFYLRNAVNRSMDYESLGIPFTNVQILMGDAEGSFTMRDTSETIPYDYKHYLIPNYMQEYTSYPEKKFLKRNNTWKACVYNPTEEQDGWQAFIVKNSFAVVVGMERDTEVTEETLEIPSKIGKYPVKEVSILGYEYTVPAAKTLKIPSSVENVSILNTYASYSIENLEIAEGVETVRIDSYLAQSVSLPASAHYVDFRLSGGMRGDYNDFYTEQKVTVADGGHYYTKDGYLYSKEGDLCYQFANRDELNLRIDETAKRVLPHSVNGAAKNIYIPAGIEYFDLCFTRGGLRDWSNLDSNNMMGVIPLLFISSDKVARRLIEETVQDYGYAGLPPMLLVNSLPLSEYKEKVFELLATLDFDSAQLEEAKNNCAFKECTAGYSCFIVKDGDEDEELYYCSVVDFAFAAEKMGLTPAPEQVGYLGRAVPNYITGEDEWKIYTWIGEGEPTQAFDPILENFKQQENAK